jgi:hypothetical protein
MLLSHAFENRPNGVDDHVFSPLTKSRHCEVITLSHRVLFAYHLFNPPTAAVGTVKSPEEFDLDWQINGAHQTAIEP